MNAKTGFYAVVALLVLILGAALGYVVLSDDDDSEDTEVVTTDSDTQDSEASAANEYTLAEVAEHDTEDDCWLAIDGNVYDATDYIAEHPPGPESIVLQCGTDNTEGFNSVGAHGGAADILPDYLIGTLVE